MMVMSYNIIFYITGIYIPNTCNTKWPLQLTFSTYGNNVYISERTMFRHIVACLLHRKYDIT